MTKKKKKKQRITLYIEKKFKLRDTCSYCNNTKMSFKSIEQDMNESKDNVFITNYFDTYTCENCKAKVEVHIQMMTDARDDFVSTPPHNVVLHYFIKHNNVTIYHSFNGPAYALYQIDNDFKVKLFQCSFHWYGIPIPSKYPVVNDNNIYIDDSLPESLGNIRCRLPTGKPVRKLSKNMILKTLLFNRNYGTYLRNKEKQINGISNFL